MDGETEGRKEVKGLSLGISREKDGGQVGVKVVLHIVSN